jgi:hypothetical protein
VLYGRYRFDEPWNGPNNRKLAAEMPDCYRCLVHDPRRLSCETSYLAVVGAEGPWLGAEPRQRADFTGGLADAVLVLEGPPQHVNWMAPNDLTLADAQRLLTAPDRGDDAHVDDSGLFTKISSGRVAAMANGAVVRLPASSTAEAASALLSPTRPPSGNDAVAAHYHWKTTIKWLNLLRLAVLVLLIVLPVWRFVRPDETPERAKRAP